MAVLRSPKPLVGVRVPGGTPDVCRCVAEWLGRGLQIRIMQVQVLSPTPNMRD